MFRGHVHPLLVVYTDISADYKDTIILGPGRRYQSTLLSDRGGWRQSQDQEESTANEARGYESAIQTSTLKTLETQAHGRRKCTGHIYSVQQPNSIQSWTATCTSRVGRRRRGYGRSLQITEVEWLKIRSEEACSACFRQRTLRVYLCWWHGSCRYGKEGSRHWYRIRKLHS